MTRDDDAEEVAAGDAGPSLVDRRQRVTRRIVIWGTLGAGGGLAVVTGLLGATGRGSLAILLLVSAASLAVAALYAVATLALDDLRGEPTPRRRVVTALGLFLGAAALMAMVAGIGG